MNSQFVFPPDLDDILVELKNEIFATLNSIQIGKINSVNIAEQSVTVEIQVKRRVEGSETQFYPLLTDVPFFVFQGGGAFLDFPVAKGDYCLLFFNDRDIDNWWTTSNVKEPKTKRKHSLSDAFALVGINPKSNVLGLDGTKVVLEATGKTVEIKGNLLNIFAANQSFMKGDEWKTRWTTLNASVQGATSGTTAQNASGIETIKTAFNVFAGFLTNMLSTKIKGE